MFETFIVSVGGFDLEVIKWGEHKSRFLFLHGFGGNARTFSKVIERLVAQGFGAISISLPFHGGSADPDINQRLDIKALGSDLADMCEQQFGMDTYALVSHSLGSRVILWMATYRSEKLSSIHIMNPAGFYPIEIRYFSTFKSGWGAKVLQWNWLSKTLTSYLIPNPEPRVIDAFKWICLSYDALCLHKTGVFMQLFKIAQPVHIYWGDRDKLLPVPFADEVKQHFVNATVHIIENCGHLPMIHQPEKTAQILKENL